MDELRSLSLRVAARGQVFKNAVYYEASRKSLLSYLGCCGGAQQDFNAWIFTAGALAGVLGVAHRRSGHFSGFAVRFWGGRRDIASYWGTTCRMNAALVHDN